MVIPSALAAFDCLEGPRVGSWPQAFDCASFDLGSYRSPTRLHRVVLSRVSVVCCDEVELNCGPRFLICDLSTPRLKFYNTGVNNHTSELSFFGLDLSFFLVFETTSK